MKIKENIQTKLFIMLVCLIFSVFLSYLILLESSNTYYWTTSNVKYSQEESDQFSTIDFDDSNWKSYSLNNIPTHHTNFWLRINFELSQLGHFNPPYALYLSGLFSAEVYLNGRKIYDKGMLKSKDKQEIAGKIDSVIYIPEHELVSGNHLLAMKISTTKLGYQAENFFHLIAIGKHDSDERRELRYYALPLILSSGFLLLFFQFIKIANSSGTPYLGYLSLACIFALLQLVSEVSRSFVSYPYNFHLFRSLLIWSVNYLSVASLLLWLSNRLKNHIFSLLVYSTLIFNLIISYFMVGFDEKTVTQIQITSFVMIFGTLLHLNTKDLLVYSSALLGCSWLIVSQISQALLLDGIFFSCYIVFLGFVWWWISTGKQSSDTQLIKKQQCSGLTIKDTGRSRKISVKDILFIKAEGNFAELNCSDGSQHLHHLRLGQIMEKGLTNFLRIHRSYSINLEYLIAIRSKEGSRYFAEIKGHLIPVSRYKIADLRREFNRTQ